MILLTLALGLTLGLGWVLHHRLTYWQRRGIPSPGLLYQWRYYKSELTTTDMELAAKYGPIYGVLEGLNPTLILSDLTLIREVLVKNFGSFPNHKPVRIGDPHFDLNLFALEGNGDDWRRIRSLLSPAFTAGKLRAMEAHINSCVSTAIENMHVVAASGAARAGAVEPCHFDAKKYFNALAFDVLTRCAYGTQIDSLADPENPIQANFDAFFSSGRWSFLFLTYFPKMAGILGVKGRALKYFYHLVEMVEALLEERVQKLGDLEHKQKFNDFLQIMVEANKLAEGAGAGAPGEAKASLNRDEMISQAFLFLVAGFDTTATALTMAAYHLATNATVQQKLRAELPSLPELSLDSVGGLKYLDGFIKETFRLTSPVVRIERECVRETVLRVKGQNLRVHPGTIVSIPVFVVHHDPTVYPNPEECRPERWWNDHGEALANHPFAYLPFGGGPRFCIAQRFVLAQIKLTLARILQEFQFETTAETKLRFRPGETDSLVPEPILLKLTRVKSK